MILRTRPSFWRAYAPLDSASQEAARKAFGLFQANPWHPSLRFKKLGGYDHIWSARINQQYRVVGKRNGRDGSVNGMGTPIVHCLEKGWLTHVNAVHRTAATDCHPTH